MAGGGGAVVGGLLMKVFVGMLMVVGVVGAQLPATVEEVHHVSAAAEEVHHVPAAAEEVHHVPAAAAEVHHVVGGQVGWHPQVNLASWSSGRLFTVGDKLWFSYSPAHEGVVELQTLEEYLSCDLTNPIRMYTDGMSKVPLEEVKIHYFASGSLESCKNGLKLHMKVLPKEVVAVGPRPRPTPSKASTIINGLSLMSLIGLSISILG